MPAMSGTSPANFPVIALLSRKGGSGKTTLSTHLAVAFGAAGRRVVLVDCDPQASATAWAELRVRLRGTQTPEVIQCTPAELRNTLAKVRRGGSGLVVIDSQPGVGPDIAPIAKAADLVLIPCRPSVLDLLAIRGTVEEVKRSRVPAAIVMNACPSRRGVGEASVVIDARRALAEYGLPILAQTIGERASLRHALSGGAAVAEFEPSGRAAMEITALATFAEKQLWQSRLPSQA
jgi:chromosome partitioning protein